jgi:hypothetical protein
MYTGWQPYYLGAESRVCVCNVVVRLSRLGHLLSQISCSFKKEGEEKKKRRGRKEKKAEKIYERFALFIMFIYPFLTAMRLRHYLGKLFVAFTRFLIEGISNGNKTTVSKRGIWTSYTE